MRAGRQPFPGKGWEEDGCETWQVASPDYGTHQGIMRILIIPMMSDVLLPHNADTQI